MTEAPSARLLDSALPPIRQRVDVPLPPREAFDLFTRDIARWWPLARHSLSARAGHKARGLRIEPRIGGRVVEEREDGRTETWARVTEWSPGRRLSLDWSFDQPEEETTQVLLVFSRIEGGTRVDLTHSGFEHLEARGLSMRAGYRAAWGGLLLPRFVEASQRLPVPA